MLYRIRDGVRRARFSWMTREILRTSSMRLQPGVPVALLTQLQHKDVRLALIALKSFAARIPVGSVYIVNDGSLTSNDLHLLREHIPVLTMLHTDTLWSKSCPRGGTWERLLAIADLIRQDYVIQLDSDTLSLGDLPEVAACVEDKVSFVIGTWDNQGFESMESRRRDALKAKAKTAGVPHIQLTAEAHFDALEGYATLRYVRGCSGFAGFARGSFERRFVEEVSQQMRAALGDRWHEWGSEQVMSNIVVANSRGSRVLPHPKYCDCRKIRGGETVFVHFIGSCRFVGDTYASMARQVIEGLRVTTMAPRERQRNSGTVRP